MPAVQRDNLFGNGKPKAYTSCTAGIACVKPVERFEDRFKFVLWNTNPFIFNADRRCFRITLY